jgi:uncharacterized protein (DUF1499 family)
MIYNSTLTSALAATAAVIFLTACTSAPEKPATMAALPECGWLPNCVRTGTDDADQAAKPLAASVAKWQALKSWLAQQPNWTIVENDSNFMQLTVTTPTMEFTDDVQLLFNPGQQLIQVRSSSRLGISDMGTNAQRLETLREQLVDL